jgi:hypothetical protein
LTPHAHPHDQEAYVRHFPCRPAALAALATLGLPLAGLAAPPAAAQSPPGAATAPAVPAVSVPATAGPVLLLNGDVAVPQAVPSGPPACAFTINFAPVPGASGQVQTLRVAGKTFVIPVAAAPYLGRGLDPSLFDLAALSRIEAGGRLPVDMAFSGGLPKLPGVTVTHPGAGTAQGYLTRAGAEAFGRALVRQFAADHGRGSYGQDGMFAGGVSLHLAGAPSSRPSPHFPMQTLTVTGTNLAGRPDSGDLAWVFNVDNAARFDNVLDGAWNPFDHGTTRFSVPAGHYWALGEFIRLNGRSFSDRLTVLPQFRVAGRTTVNLAERAASSKVTMTTPRPAAVAASSLDLIRFGAAGPAMSLSFMRFGGQGVDPGGVFISPTRRRPTVGKLDTVATQQLDSPAGAPGLPYQYDLAFIQHGRIGSQHYAARPAGLATVTSRFYSAVNSAGSQGRAGMFPAQGQACGTFDGLMNAKVPAKQIAYLSTGHSLAWLEGYVQTRAGFGSGGQFGFPRVFRPRQRATENWGAYPLHFAPDVVLPGTSRTSSAVPSAARSGNSLALDWNAFSDSTPGHTGGGVFPPLHATASYQIDQNGKRVAGGNVPQFFGFFLTSANLAPGPSVIRFSLTAHGPANVYPLSGTNHTVWTWHSARPRSQPLPPGWTCLFPSPSGCAVEPLLTLRYAVRGLSLAGAAPAGAQHVRINVGHLQLARPFRITRATVSVSFDGGKTWHPARISGGNGSYTAAFTAPAGARVTMRTSAADAGGGTITETITNAYGTAR